jgi:mannose-6-phosphate isomerase
MGPLRFRPHLRPLVWGGRRLGEALGRHLPGPGPYGESWDVSDHAAHRSVVAEGPLAGRSLRELMETRRDDLLGPAGHLAAFPWLVKHLDAADRLSVQVHPDDEQAARLWPGEIGKTEAWFVLDAAPDGRVYAGLKAGVDEATLRRAVADGTAADCLHSFRPRPGDCLFLRAGTVHAVGGGVLFAEVQQTSDATFRLYDWGRVDAQGRGRQMHVEESLACIDWSAGPVEPVRARGYPRPGEPADPSPVSQRLASCRYFELDYVRRAVPFALWGAGRLRALIVAHGRGRLAGMTLAAGDVLVLPASMGAETCEPDGALGLVLATLPG